MKVRNELLIFILIVLIIPVIVIAGYSTRSLTANAKEEMSLQANLLAERCDSTFSEIEKQCLVLAEIAGDIENNPHKYMNLYREEEYYEESRGAFVTTKPVRYLFSLDSAYKRYLQEERASGELRRVFEEKGHSLPAQAEIKNETEGEWSIGQDFAKYLIKESPEELEVYFENDLAKMAIWVPNTVPITKEMKGKIGLTKNLESAYKSIRLNNPGVEWVPAYYENGLMLVYPFMEMETTISSGNYSCGKHPSVLKIKENPSNLVWSSPYWDVGGKGWMITCFAKVYDKNNELVCLQTLDVTLKRIEGDIMRTKLYDTGYAFLVDERGNLLALPRENKEAEKDLLVALEGMVPSLEEIEQMKDILNVSLLDHSNEQFVRSIEKAIKGEALPIEEVKFDKEKYLAFVPIKSTGWVVGVVVPIGEVLAPVRNAITIALIVAVVVALGASLFAGKRFAQPLIKLSETSDKITKGNLDARVDTRTPIEEFSSVGTDINLMVDSLVKREAEVREAKLYAEAIIANIADPLWVTDREGNWILVNEAMERVTGYDKKEVSEKQMLAHPLFGPFISMLDGKEKLKAMIKKIKAGEHVPGVFIPWLTKDKKMLMMSCSGEPLRDAEGNVIGGVFIGKDMSTLQRAGISATKVLTKKVEAEVGKNYELATLLFISNATIIVGDSSLEILRGTVEGYNRRFNKSIGIKEGIALTNMPEEEWPPFLEFLLCRFFECIGPTTFECCEGIESIKDIVEKVKVKYGGGKGL
jgi:PAS domain S-box-containing protein